MFDFSLTPSQRFASVLNSLRQGPVLTASQLRQSAASVSPAPAEADQSIGQAGASAGHSVSVNRARQVNEHVQTIRIVIDPDVIKKLANGSLLEEMRIKNELMGLFADLHGTFSNEQDHQVVVGSDGSQTVNSQAQVDNNPQLVSISFRQLDGSPELQAANPVLSLSADSLNQAGLAPISAVQVMDQGAFADGGSRSVNRLRQEAEKNQETAAKVDDDVVAGSREEFFQNLIDLVNHVLYGSKDGPSEPPIQQSIQQAAGAEDYSLAMNLGDQLHQARQNVTIYIGDFDPSGSDLTHDFESTPASRYLSSRLRTAAPRSSAFFANFVA